MVNSQVAFELFAFCLAWWLGLYLLGRDPKNPQLLFTGLGLATYALGLAAILLSQFAGEQVTEEALARWGWPLLFLPALFWFGSMFYLQPKEAPIRRRLGSLVGILLIPLAIIFYIVAVSSNLIVSIAEGDLSPGPWYPIFAVMLFVFLMASLLIVIRSLSEKDSNYPRSIFLVVTIFFGLGTGLLLLPLEILPDRILILAIGLDLALLGVTIAVLDALSQGETLLPDMARSLTFSFFAIVIFGGQVVLAMALSTGLTLPMLALLLAIIVSTVVVQTFADPIQEGLDWIVFRRFPRVRQTRADMRLVSSAMPRKKESLDPGGLSEDQFTRLTRRALSQMGNLPRLAASPLTRMTIIERRISARGSNESTLERAAELKNLLIESILQLKPSGEIDHGTTDAWRFYNALYYPYVVGLKPYSRHVIYGELEAGQQQALVWFKGQVPERTLHNWQNAAARLVAQYIREISAEQTTTE
jgi:hypothetical protein